MSNSSASASASVADPLLLAGEYEVFLNFCGTDTRYGFTDYLYTSLHSAGIRTFRDDSELRVGEEIGLELVRAINDSKISIPIFSKNYASRKWCLIELAHMVQCLKNGGQMIFPIFYDVDPDDVHHQLGTYEEAFRQHKKRRYDKEVIQEWKNALKNVGQLKGLELKKETGGHEGELVKIITDKVLEVLRQNNKHEDLDLVGMPSRIEKMDELLNIHSDDVRFIGIYGMGGLGKTTIANVIYNKYQHHFECHSFLKDVRETESHNGIVHLQKKLLVDILKTKTIDIDDYNHGIKKIKETVCRKKVLIVLDDVNEKSQIDRLAGSWKWFGARARIIITTRDREVLRALEHSREGGHPEVYGSYQPNYLNADESLELFNKYAFMSKCPPEGYDTLSKDIASTAAGLPLVLVVTGSSLYGETDVELWEEKIKELEKLPAEEVQKKLRLSFDPLSGAQKEIFLDIACLFIGRDKTNPCYMWHDCGFYPRNVLNVLVRKSLITVGDDNILGMHDQLRDLGKHIACEGKLDECGKWSRLWDCDKAFEVYRTGQGSKNIKALCLDLHPSTFPSNWKQDLDDWEYDLDDWEHDLDDWEHADQRHLEGKKFLRLPHLRYLTLNARDNLYGDFEHCLPNLRWLQWRYCSLEFTPTNLHLRNLVILDLSFSDITDDSDIWNQIKISKKLKVLDLRQCVHLRRFPFLSTFSNLERLMVNECCELRSLDGIEEMESLRILDATNCGRLETLPNLSKLTKLKELKVTCCNLIIDIPWLEKLESLELLWMWSCKSLERLPDLSNLKRLRRLNIRGCPKLIEILALEGLESLEFLDIDECKSIEVLPDLSKLKSLKKLSAQNCSALIKIESLHKLESLEYLDMRGCASIEKFPKLPNIEIINKLDLSRCSNLHEVQGLQFMESLESLNLYGCEALEIIDLRNLKNLKKLDISFLLKLNEIRGLEDLESLELLFMVGCKSIESLLDFSNLRKLEVINANGCEKLTEIRGLENLESLSGLFIDKCKSLINTRRYFQAIRIRMHMDFDKYYESDDYLRSLWYSS